MTSETNSYPADLSPSTRWQRIVSAALASPARVFAVCFAWLAAWAWLRPLAVPDEGRYTDIARWMVSSGDWLVPRLDGIAFLHKPPLYFWIEGAFVAILGTSALVARLTSLLAAALLCMASAWFVRHWLGERAARWTLAVLALNPLLVLGAQYANLDMLVAAWIGVTILLAAHASLSPPDRQRPWWMAAYASAALAVLAKGLIGCVLPGAVFVAWCLAERKPGRILTGVSAAGLLAFVVVVVPWFVAVEHATPGFLHYFFIHHHLERFVQTGFNNMHGVWFYPVVLALGLLPWVACAWAAVRAGWRAAGVRRSLTMLGLIWFILILVFFSIPPSKLAGYILPVLPAFALVVGPWVAQWAPRRRVAWGAAVLCGGIALALVPAQKDPPARLAQQVRAQIGTQDRVAFWDAYYFAVPIALGRSHVVEVVGDWSTPGAQLPDNWRRELKEGAEFDPRHAQALVSVEAFRASLEATPGAVWLFAGADEAAHQPWLAQWQRMAEQGGYVVLRWMPQTPDTASAPDALSKPAAPSAPAAGTGG